MYGHAAGDSALCTLSEQLRLAVGGTGFVCRWGGDEFVGIIEGNAEAVKGILENMSREIRNIKIDDQFLSQYPQFRLMLKEHKKLNFFDLMGHNEHCFSEESIMFAISNNYNQIKKYADVLCTEDKDGYLTMLPINQISQWAEIEGEIRSAGRNDYKVWTANALKKFLNDKNAIINGNTVVIDKKYLETRKIGRAHV